MEGLKNREFETHKSIPNLPPVGMKKAYSTYSRGLFYPHFGLTKSKYHKIKIDEKDVQILNETGEDLLHFFLIHRCSRVTPHACNLFYKKILTGRMLPVEKWPFLDEPYDKTITQKDVIEINFSIQRGEEIHPYTNLGLTNIQIEIPQFSVTNPIQISITKQRQTGNIIGQIKYASAPRFAGITDFFSGYKTENIVFESHNQIQIFRKKSNQKIQKDMRNLRQQKETKGQKGASNLLQGINFPSKLTFRAGPQIRAVFYSRVYKKQFWDKFRPLHSRDAYLSQESMLSQGEGQEEQFQKVNKTLIKSHSIGSIGCLGQSRTLGDCYLIAALDQIISQAPKALEEIYILQCGVVDYVCVVLNVDGFWIPIQVDGKFPISRKKRMNSQQQFYYSHFKNGWYDDQLRSLIKKAIFVEKCMAKLYGSYFNLTSGCTLQIFMAVTNSNTKIFKIQKQFDKNQELLQRMRLWKQNEHNETKILITLSSPKKQKIIKHSNNLLLDYIDDIVKFHKHAYSFYGLDEIPSKQHPHALRIVRLRNSVGSMAVQWMIGWRKKNEPKYDRWRKFRNNQKESNYQFLIEFEELMQLYMDAEVCQYNFNNSYVSIPTYMEHQRKAKFNIEIRQPGWYYFSIHKKNARHFMEHLYESSSIWSSLDEQKLVDNIKELNKTHQYFKSRLLFKKRNGSQQSLEIQEQGTTNSSISYLKCSLQKGHYNLLAVIYHPLTYKNNEVLAVSCLGKDFSIIQVGNLPAHQSRYIQYLPMFIGGNLLQIKDTLDQQFWIPFVQGSKCLRIKFPQDMNKTLGYDLRIFNEKGDHLLDFTLQKIDEVLFTSDWEKVHCQKLYVVRQHGFLQLWYVVRRNFKAGKYKLTIQFLNKKFWMSTKMCIIIQWLTDLKVQEGMEVVQNISFI